MRTPVTVAFLAACLVSLPRMIAAQTSPNAIALFSLDKLRYDPAERGPLLLVEGPDMHFSPILRDLSGDTVNSLAEKLNRKVVRLGTMTLIAPTTMRIIEEHPGKPDPYAGLRTEERLRFLLSLFTEGQWKQAGSARGIGLADMNEQQRSLYTGLLPEKMVVQRIKLTQGGAANSTLFVPQGDPHEYDPLSARLRLVRQVHFSFSKDGANDYAYAGSLQAEIGEEQDILQTGGRVRGDVNPDSDSILAFGVPIIRTVPSRLKDSQIDFASPNLNRVVTLDSDVKTVSDLLQRIAQVTGFELIADKRVAGLRLTFRSDSARKARGGDLLMALCWSVTGAIRRAGTSTYLLTDDVKGIGERFARLMEWGSLAISARRKAMDALNDITAKNDPLSHIGFAPGDPRSLPPDLLQTVDTNYRKERYGAGPDVDPGSLPGPLQRGFESQVQFWASQGVSLRRDKTRINTEMAAQFVLPGGEAVEAPFSNNIGSQFLQQIATMENPRASRQAPASVPSKSMSKSLKKRVLIVGIPSGDKALQDLVSTAKAKGFTEIWLRLLIGDAQSLTLLKTAVEMGEKAELRVGAAVSLLRNGGMPGTEEVNIFGETGAAYIKRRDLLQPDYHDYRAALSGWTILSPDEAVSKLLPIARLEGLCGLAIKATAAPGWSGESAGGDGIESTGYLGYDPQTRLACIRSQAIDPIDATTHSYELGTTADLPFFPNPQKDGAWSSVMNWRLNQNTKALALIHAGVRAAVPDLPLYLDDRVSPYADPNTHWYSRWDMPDRLPHNPVYAVDSEGREAAFASSVEPLLTRYGWNGNPLALARSAGNVAEQAAKSWRGFVLDLSKLAPPDAIKMLGGLPDF